MLRIALISLLLFLCTGIYAQWSVQFEAGRGYLIAHRPLMVQMQQDHSTKFGLTIAKNQQNSDWGGKFIQPKSGLSFHVITTGNPDVVGTAYSLQYQLSTRLTNWKNPLVFSLGAGLGYLTKRYSFAENRKNPAIGSHFNASIFFKATQFVKIKNDLIGLFLSMNHYSNGAFRSPNLGINLPTVGISYAPNSAAGVAKNPEIKPKLHPKESSIGLDVGFKERATEGGASYLNATINYTYTFKTAGLSAFNVFASTSINRAISADISGNVDITQEFTEPKVPRLADYQAGLGIGYTAYFGKTAIFLQQGVYLLNHQPNSGNLYHRLGVQQDLTNRLRLVLVLKSHFAQAQYVGIGLGIKLNKRNE